MYRELTTASPSEGVIGVSIPALTNIANESVLKLENTDLMFLTTFIGVAHTLIPHVKVAQGGSHVWMGGGMLCEGRFLNLSTRNIDGHFPLQGYFRIRESVHAWHYHRDFGHCLCSAGLLWESIWWLWENFAFWKEAWHTQCYHWPTDRTLMRNDSWNLASERGRGSHPEGLDALHWMR